jgi:hypothetical protein
VGMKFERLWARCRHGNRIARKTEFIKYFSR